MRSRDKTRLALASLCSTVLLTLGGCGSIVDAAAEKQFKQDVGSTSITVFPAALRRDQITYDAGAARQLADFLTARKLADATASEAEVPLTGSWHANQATMWKESAQALAAYVKEHPIKTRYALLPEYLGGKEAAVGVHLYVVREDGKVVSGFLLNSHWEAFKDVTPKTVADCTTVLLNQLNAELAPGGASAKLSATPALGPESSVTIVPVMLAGSPSKDVADVVGLMLEKEGMPNIWTIDTAFVPPADQSLDEVATAFGQFVQKTPPQTDHALFAEFLGTPQTGLREGRAILVDKAGRVVWKDRQLPEDADFQRIKPREPMECCVLLSERLKPVFHLPAAKKTAGEGRMAQLWAEKSGTPSDAERSAMEASLGKLKASIGTARFVVYPVLLGDEVNRPDAEQLVGLIAKDFGSTVQMAPTPALFKIAPSSNEQKRLWDLARAFRTHLRDNPPDADYALYAEYTIRPSNQEVWSVHFVVCDRGGEWVIVDFQNDHQADFQQIDPKTHQDCARLVVRRLKSYVR